MFLGLNIPELLGLIIAILVMCLGTLSILGILYFTSARAHKTHYRLNRQQYHRKVGYKRPQA